MTQTATRQKPRWYIHENWRAKHYKQRWITTLGFYIRTKGIPSKVVFKTIEHHGFETHGEAWDYVQSHLPADSE